MAKLHFSHLEDNETDGMHLASPFPSYLDEAAHSSNNTKSSYISKQDLFHTRREPPQGRQRTRDFFSR